MKNIKTNTYGLIVSILLLVGFVGVLAWINIKVGTFEDFGVDLLPRWNATRQWLLQGKNLYSEEITRESTNLIMNQYATNNRSENAGEFLYPIYAVLFYAPVAVLEFLAAKWIWVIISSVAIMTIATLGLKKTELKSIKFPYTIITTVLVMGSYYAVITISAGAFTPINALVLLMAVYCVVNRKFTAAGILFALATIQPQMSYLVIIYSIFWAFITGRIRILTAFFITLFLLCGTGYLLFPGWINGFLSLVVPLIRDSNWQGAGVMTISNIFPGIQQRLAEILFFLTLLMMLVYWYRGRLPEEKIYLWTAYFTLSITCIITPYSQVGFNLMLFPSLFLINGVLTERLGRFGYYSGFTVLILLIAAGWTIHILSHGSLIADRIIQIIFPILTLIGLAWGRWWITRSPDRYIE